MLLDPALDLVQKPLQIGDEGAVSVSSVALSGWAMAVGIIISIVALIAFVCNRKLPAWFVSKDAFAYHHKYKEGEPVHKRCTNEGSAWTIPAVSTAAFSCVILIATNSANSNTVLKPLPSDMTAVGTLRVSVFVPVDNCLDFDLPQYVAAETVGFPDDAWSAKHSSAPSSVSVGDSTIEGCEVALQCDECSTSLLNEVTFSVPPFHQVPLSQNTPSKDTFPLSLTPSCAMLISTTNQTTHTRTPPHPDFSFQGLGGANRLQHP